MHASTEYFASPGPVYSPGVLYVGSSRRGVLIVALAFLLVATASSCLAQDGAIRTNLYRLEVQLLLDINCMNDRCFCRSYTVFDEWRSRFHLPTEKNTAAFINVYVDLYEIERRKMQHTLDSARWTAAQVDSVYKATLRSAKAVTTRYLGEVKAGDNARAMEKWKEFVRKERAETENEL